MNNFFIKIQNQTVKFISFDEINPHKHWKYLINIFFIFIFILILLSFYFMYQIKNQQIFQVIPTSTEKSILINENLLKNTEQYFFEKSVIEKEIREGNKYYPDPSL